MSIIPKFKVTTKPLEVGQHFPGTYEVIVIDWNDKQVLVKRCSVFQQQIFSFDEIESIEELKSEV